MRIRSTNAARPECRASRARSTSSKTGYDRDSLQRLKFCTQSAPLHPYGKAARIFLYFYETEALALKIFISSDMEGSTGVVSPAQVRAAGGIRFRTRAAGRDMRAAVRGALDAGAERVVICDAHGSMTNLDIAEFGKHVSLASGSPKVLGMVEGAAGCAAAFFVGYHAMAGTEKAVLDHTFDSRTIYGLTVNGVKMGETGVNAPLCGALGVPVALATGDDALCAEARSLLRAAAPPLLRKGGARARSGALPHARGDGARNLRRGEGRRRSGAARGAAPLYARRALFARNHLHEHAPDGRGGARPRRAQRMAGRTPRFGMRGSVRAAALHLHGGGRRARRRRIIK